MSMGGGRGGVVAHGGGGFSRGPVYGGVPRAGGYWGGGFHGPGWQHPPNGGWGWHGGSGWRRPPYGYYPYRYWGRGYWGYGYGASWYPGWGWYGGVGWYDNSYSYPAQSYPNYVYAFPDNSAAYAPNGQVQQEEIDRLNQEVARLREEQVPRQPPSPVPSPPKAEVHAETVLVFRDRHVEEIQNYAIVGKILWVFTEQRARKIPIAELDVPATSKANAARGTDFRWPK